MKIRLIFSFGEYDENDLLLIKQNLIEKINFLIKKYNGETIELNNLIKIEKHSVIQKKQKSLIFSEVSCEVATNQFLDPFRVQNMKIVQATPKIA